MLYEMQSQGGSDDRHGILRVARELQTKAYGLFNRASYVLPADQARMPLSAARVLAAFCVELELRDDRQSHLPLRMPKAITAAADDGAATDAGA